ncbi:72 kDa type IV collagenase-like isoform X1 [Athalia rosae]|uniref:72 kDa type IV collagenase-like isoform X1 n=1 Tax=Athalia rosae TaxID=37344 RepID=UPI002033AB91|nr:72 kDa type IV collagenase-like isoform X1 [Athalia rosae]
MSRAADKLRMRFDWRSSVFFRIEIIVFASVLTIFKIDAAPISQRHLSLEVPPAHALEFMKKFGYIAKGSDRVEAQYSQESMSEAIRTVQKFGNIPQSGIFDNATLKLMQSPRCGIPDIRPDYSSTRRKRFVIGSSGWNKRRITYYIANWSAKLGEEAVADEIERAFGAWSGYSRLDFKQINDPSADIIVAFGRGNHGDGYAFDGPGNILAHAFFPDETGSYAGDLHFDDDEDWKTRPNDFQGQTDFYSVAVHEIGHSLGLAHSWVPSSVMFPYYKGSTPDIQLDYDDILGLYQLYITRPLEGDHLTNTHSGISENDDEIPTETIPEETTTLESQVETTTKHFHQLTYEGDYETVDDFLRHQSESGRDVSQITSRHIPRPTLPSIPDVCEGNFDAISVFRTELFVFKGEYVWRLSSRGVIMDGYPAKFRQLFWQLPENIRRIDAAYQREYDGSIILYSGNQYWIHDGYSLIEGSPRPLTDYGIDEAVDRIDAVQVWGKNDEIYLYRGEKFWRFNETSHTLDAGYPRNIRSWRGVPPNIDAAMTWLDGQTYFFKGKLFWKFDNHLIKTDSHYPLSAPQYWLGCPEQQDTVQR